MNLFQLIRSARVRRWHANPDLAHSGETNGHHQWVVASLVLSLNPKASPALVQAALWHDVGEVVAGDLPGPFKDANPEVTRLHYLAEAEAVGAICGDVPPVADDELQWLGLCDRLAAYLWMLTAAPALRHHPDWAEARLTILGRCQWLGCESAVDVLITQCTQGWE